MKSTCRMAGCAILFLFVPLIVITVVFDPWPARDGMDAARALARARGYDADDGGLADFVSQPDKWGGCEVEATFWASASQQVVVRVRRSWRWGEWKLVGILTHDKPASP